MTFPLYLNVYAGIRGLDVQLIEAGESLGLSRRGLVRHVVLPGALPTALTGLRCSLGNAWLTLVLAEQVNADSGIGFLMVRARDFLRTTVIVVCLIVYTFGLIAAFIVRSLERLLLHAARRSPAGEPQGRRLHRHPVQRRPPAVDRRAAPLGGLGLCASEGIQGPPGTALRGPREDPRPRCGW